MIDELAPHQAALAEMLGKSDLSKTANDQENSHSQSPDGDPADGLRAGWLTELKHDPARALDGLQRTVQEHRGDAAQSQMLADLALRYSENRDKAEPEPAHRACGSQGDRVNLLRDGKPVRVTLDTTDGGYLERLCPEHRQELDGKLAAQLAPGSDTGACQFPVRQRPDDAKAYCDWCGNASPEGLEEGDSLGTGDTPCSCHGLVTMPCRDSEACSQRREERYPADLSRVPSWIFTAQQRLTDEASRTAILAACSLALGDYLELAAREDEETELELAAHFPGWTSSEYGVVNRSGDWLPAPAPSYNVNWAHINWQHSLRNPAHHSHLISGNHLSPARISAMAAVSQARSAQVARDGAQQPQGRQGGRREIPAEGLSPGQAEALHGDHPGGDLPVLGHAQPGHDGAPQRPARIPGDRFGKRRYPRRRSR